MDTGKAGRIINSRLRRRGNANKLLMTTADVSALGGQRKFYRVFPPFQGKLPEQSRNGKYIGLLTFPSWEEGYYIP
jgi:hypothetical protein